jgi:RHS repeat-associated protein
MALLSASTGERAGVRCRIPLPSVISHLPPSLIALFSIAARVFACGGTPEGTPKRLRLPSYGWRFATVVTLIAMIGCDPALDGLWTARAACGDVPSTNLSTNTVRITNFSYDLEGRLAQVDSPEGYINYEYDLATGRHLKTCTANSTTSYEYDDLGRLWKVNVLRRNNAPVSNETTVYDYTAVGSRKSITLPNGVKTSYAYDDHNRLTGLTNRASDNSILSMFNYQVDATGRRTNAVEVVKTETTPTYQTNTLTWQYDGLYRLTNETSTATVAGGSYTNRYTYDKAGNRVKKVRLVGSLTETTVSVFNANDQLTREEYTPSTGTAGTNYFVYDANGSVIARTNVPASGSSTIALYGYDLKNKLSEVANYSGGWSTNRFEYNASGIRVRSTPVGGTAKRYLVDANNHTGYAQVLEETTGSTLTSYVLGDDVLAQGVSAVSYLLYDGHGSTRQLTPNTLNTTSVTCRYNYDAYGTTMTSTSSGGALATSLLYCGEQYDSTLNMYNLRARFYDPSNGRFNARDTFMGNNEDPQSLHKYAFCHADPMNGSDPTGHAFTMNDFLIWVGIVVPLSIVTLVGVYAIGGSIVNNLFRGSSLNTQQKKALSDARDYILQNEKSLPRKLQGNSRVARTLRVDVKPRLYENGGRVWAKTDNWGNSFGNLTHVAKEAFYLDKRVLAAILVHEGVHTGQYGVGWLSDDSMEREADQITSEVLRAWHLENANALKKTQYDAVCVEDIRQHFHDCHIDNPVW